METLSPPRIGNRGFIPTPQSLIPSPDQIQFLVLELVEGPTLADRIAQGPIPIDEALAIAKEMGYKIKEMPVFWVNDTRSHVSPTAYLQVLWEVVKVRWWLFRNAYGIKNN